MYTTLAVAHEFLVYGRGSEPGPDNSRVLSEMGKFRVDAVDQYIGQNVFESGRLIRVQFSAGWAAGEGMAEPDMQFREAVLMDQYAEDIGLKDRPGVVTDVQPDSYSTTTDGLFSARSGFFGNRRLRFSEDNPFAVVAQAGQKYVSNPQKLDGHMARCLDATQRIYRIPREALLPLVAEGTDVPGSGMPENMVTFITRVVNLGARSDHSLLVRDQAMINISVGVQKVINRIQQRHAA